MQNANVYCLKLCRLMENGPPEANFEVQYYSGQKFTYSTSKGHWSSNVSVIPDPTQHPDFRSWSVERDRIRHLEKMMEDLEKEEELKRLPGKRLVIPLSILYSNHFLEERGSFCNC